ncbi:MAG TPA: tail fiber domain-containing protein [Pyrinomonadaceae bacterium]
MKRKNSKALSLFAAVVLISVAFTVAGQTPNESNIANVVGGGSGVRWEVGASNNGGTLTITFPDGRSVRKTFRAGSSPQISLGEKNFENLPDGVYVYELQLTPVISPAQKETAAKSRGKDDDPESERAGRKRTGLAPLVQSGSFAVVNGSIITPGAVEPESARPKASAAAGAALSAAMIRRARSHHFALFNPDFVIADDLIVQGSACVGLDCVDGENFGFDTIRVKENNTRIQYDDTSTSAGFPTNNWQIRANSSASGGESFLGFVDQGTTGNSETGTIVFQVNAGAPANSVRVASNGKVGFRTATPVLDLHMNTSDTPAVRFEQNNTSGFTAQTWDVAGNEANFFVRDVTSGSRLPFRIRPGAPTSSIDISATGNVGVGTGSPSFKMSVASDATGSDPTIVELRGATNANRHLLLGYETTANYGYISAGETGVGFKILALNPNGGNVGIGTNAPTQLLSVNGTAGKPGGGTWDVFSDERLKNVKGRYNTGLKALMQLQPLRYEYKSDNALGIKLPGEQIGFGAQAVQKIIPEAVTRDSTGYLMVKSDPILWTMLNAIKEQQKQIVELRREVRRLRASRTRRR